MVQDASFDRIFEQYFQKDIQRANLDERELVVLENPLLPEIPPFNRSELWCTPRGACSMIKTSTTECQLTP